jgi:hypothetical protein
MTRVSGVVKSQDLIDHVFWLIDSHSIGELAGGFKQVIYVEAIESIALTEADIYKVANISMGLGRNRGRYYTAIIAREPFDKRLAYLHKTLARDADLEVEVCTDFATAFTWLGIVNPDPVRFR